MQIYTTKRVKCVHGRDEVGSTKSCKKSPANDLFCERGPDEVKLLLFPRPAPLAIVVGKSHCQRGATIEKEIYQSPFTHSKTLYYVHKLILQPVQ